jgi:hypothetical protein
VACERCGGCVRGGVCGVVCVWCAECVSCGVSLCVVYL